MSAASYFDYNRRRLRAPQLGRRWAAAGGGLRRQKGEYAISVALAGALLLTILLARNDWQSASIEDVASSAEEFIFRATGIGQVPDIAGYERLATYRLGRYRAGLYRAAPAPLSFAPGRFIIYNRKNEPVFKLETLESAQGTWTQLYDFAGRQGLAVPGSRARPLYTHSLTGNGQPDVVVGQYSGGEHCCTTITIIELRKDAAQPLGQIEALDGLPFDGLELRKIAGEPGREIVAHRGYQTLCSGSVDLPSVYAYAGGQYTEQNARSAEYLKSALEQNLARWSRQKSRSIQLLQTLAAEYAMVGKRDEGERFFNLNLPPLPPELEKSGVDSGACQEDVASLLDRLAGRSG